MTSARINWTVDAKSDLDALTVRHSEIGFLAKVRESAGSLWQAVGAGSGAEIWQRQDGAPPNTVALTDEANISTDAALGNVFTVTLAGNRTLDNPTNMKNGEWYTWIVTQDGTGSRTLAYGNKFLFPGGAPTASTAANAIDVIHARYDSGEDKLYAEMTKAYAA